MKKGVLLLTLFLFFGVFSFCQAASDLDIVINEIAWMGSSASYNDEWIELYNNTDSPISLDNWKLKAKDGTPEINLAGEIPAKGFFLLERTDDETVPSISADQIFKGALGNSGENLELTDNLGNLVDSVNSSSAWFGGDNNTKKTMERKSSLISGSDSSNWQTSQNASGTPKATNSIVVVEELKPKEELSEQQLKTKENTELKIRKEETKTYPTGILFNEILPSPKGSDETEEWIEIYNPNDFEVDLFGWKISDTAGKTTAFIFPAKTNISAKGFLVLSRPTTKITLNNDGDTLNLIQPNGNIIDKISFEKAPIGQSYNKIENSWVWNNNLTPGAVNIIPTEEQEKETGIETNREKGLAAVSEFLNEENQLREGTIEFPIILVSALGVAVFSAIVILLLKKKLKAKS